MYPKWLFFLLPLVLLIVAAIMLFVWERLEKAPAKAEAGNGGSEGAFRGFYHALWLLLLWSGLSLSVPLWVSFKLKIISSALWDRPFLVGKVIVFPVILLLLLAYGARLGYLKWIDRLEWPDGESK